LVGSEESDATCLTLVELEVEVPSLMVFLVSLGGKGLAAEPAFEPFLTCVKLDVMHQAAPVLEDLATNTERTLITPGVTH